ncbi:EAL domain-containing protein [Stenotrophomonas sp. NA06056]|uniref:EAL domain-containing protein n=1 Tax=Stenotrophomonas sp. NA06056 TaxID=2742129 RepID=UPI00158AE9D1|nr:EAL domain-containing protein [Stenotrophomonas sp. NA06056]QKW56787.1 EAL domain-containing protein [Stenotrophomonas sp. NA06056]
MLVVDQDSPGVPLAPEDLMRAMSNDELVVLYRPTVECGSQRVVGAEALVRWQHPHRGLIAPGCFIRLAEEQGLIHRLGRWMLNRACIQLREWQEAGNVDWTVSVNISPIQLRRRDFCAQVREVLHRNGIAAEKLTLQIAESCLMQQIEDCRETLADLSAEGVQIALDAFGVGFTSLARIKHLPVNEVKIDPVFIAEVDSNPVDSNIVSTIVTLGAILGLRVVADGVQRQEQRHAVELLGCDQSQGLLHAPPVSGSLFRRRFGMQAHTLLEVPRSTVTEVAFG